MDQQKTQGLLDACQPGASENEQDSEVPRLYVLLYRLRWHIRTNGYGATLKRILKRILSEPSISNGLTNDTSKPRVVRPPLNLVPGELVEVRSEEEIMATLDTTGRDRGLAFMPQMSVLAGKRFRVLKPVKNIMVDEFASTARLRPIKETVVLENAICHGAGVDCDRSCFFFWKESWLKRVNGTEEIAKRNSAPENGNG